MPEVIYCPHKNDYVSLTPFDDSYPCINNCAFATMRTCPLAAKRLPPCFGDPFSVGDCLYCQHFKTCVADKTQRLKETERRIVL